MKITTDLMQDASEILHYTIPGLPLYLKKSLLSDYSDMRAPCHWHEDVEFMRILSGEMQYEINGKRLLLRKDDCVMVNSRQMHYGFAHQHRECEFICLVFSPKLLFAGTPIYAKYVTPILENRKLEYLFFAAGQKAAAPLCALLDHMQETLENGGPAFELELLSDLGLLWRRLMQESERFPSEASAKDSSDLSAQKEMVSYLYRCYAEKITLDDIAAAGNVCRSKCCIIFRRYLQQTPIDFLNDYRLEVSAHLLKSTSAKVSEIALSCGFNHLSYFSRLFFRKYGCTPSQYRQKGAV